MLRLITLAALVLGCFAATARAAEANPPLQARVQAVVGTVEMRPAKGEPWRPVKVGMVLPPGTDLRTGFRARCVLDMTDGLVQIDPLSVVRIAELEQKGNEVRTRLHLKQGNAQAIVEKGHIESDFAILTPSATLAVQGTRGIQCRYYQDEGGTYGLVDAGLIAVIDGQTGRETGCRPGQSTDDRATPAPQHLANRYVPIALDQVGHEKQEQQAASRRRAGFAMKPHLTDSGLPANRRVQQIRLSDTSLQDLLSDIGGCGSIVTAN
jgi:hypothetical protein